MHAIYSHTENTYIHKNESKHSEMGPVRQNSIQRTVRSVHVCASHYAQLLCIILHRTDLIIFPLALQTITIAPMMSIWGNGGVECEEICTDNYLMARCDMCFNWLLTSVMLRPCSSIVDRRTFSTYKQSRLCSSAQQSIKPASVQLQLQS